MSVLSLDRASRWYGNVVAVNGISMTVRPVSPGCSDRTAQARPRSSR